MLTTNGGIDISRRKKQSSRSSVSDLLGRNGWGCP